MKVPISTAKFVSAGFGSGWLTSRGPGTIGSVAAMVAWIGLSKFESSAPWIEIAFLVLLLALGAICVESVLAAGDREDADPSWVVIDEWVGAGLAFTLVQPSQWWDWLVCLFLFRVFDIWKPGPVGQAEKLPGAVGVMSDDLIAGALAAVLWYLFVWMV